MVEEEEEVVVVVQGVVVEVVEEEVVEEVVEQEVEQVVVKQEVVKQEVVEDTIEILAHLDRRQPGLQVAAARMHLQLQEVELPQPLAHRHVLPRLEPHHVEGDLVHALLDEPQGLQLLVVSTEGSREEWPTGGLQVQGAGGAGGAFS